MTRTDMTQQPDTPQTFWQALAAYAREKPCRAFFTAIELVTLPIFFWGFADKSLPGIVFLGSAGVLVASYMLSVVLCDIPGDQAADRGQPPERRKK